ncbi:MAG: chemotaxis protein CheA [Spirochaetales bacterium]|nr:chemotaxis protein CheA [Spirochaetales bacterium]
MSENQFMETFREEAFELLGTLESNLLELEERPDDTELLSAVFRVMHTIKGSSAMFGFDRISAFSHEVESILSALRDGKIAVTAELIGNTLVSRDMILEMLEGTVESVGPLSPEMKEFLERFKTVTGLCGAEQVKPAALMVAQEKKENDAEKNSWHITFFPDKDSFRRGVNPLAVLAELNGLGEMVCFALLKNILPLSELDSEDCLTGWEIFLTTDVDENRIRDVFIFVEDGAVITIECLGDLVDESSVAGKRLGEILLKRGKIDKNRLESALKSQKRIGEVLVEEKIVSPADLKIALEEQKQLQRIQKSRAAQTDLSTIRVKSEKLDQLMALVGELVTVHARILQTTRVVSDNEELVSVVEQFGRLTDELRNNTMSIRMVPIGTTFSSFKRLVRDLSSDLGKNVELVTEGGETELDKTVIEKLNDPLIHIIRNSLDHGIEQPDARIAKGKDGTGTIRLRASQTGASVYIQIEDDGKGLDVEAIRKKAIERGLINPDEVLSEKDVYKLIFAPGFSTNEVVTEVSGRGVGMDVVNRQMELIGGTVDLESEPGVYTQVTLKIPLTLAIIDGLLVQIGEESYVIPLASVVGCLEFIQAKQKNENRIVIFHDKQLPFINMRDFFDISGTRRAIEQMVVVNVKDQHVGILVDQVVGSIQTVIKPIGKIFKRADGVASASILGDGSVALILDVERVLHASERTGS